MDIEIGGIFGLLLLIADVWAIINVIGSHNSTWSKVLWTVGILILPLIGLILWFFLGPRSARR